MRKNSKLAAPNVVGATRRNFLIKGSLVGAGALTGSAALLQTVNNEAKAQGEPIPVGQATPLTDFAAADGIEFKNGLTLACEEINALGGVLGRPLEPYFEDTKQMGDATNVQAVQRLIDRYSVHAILNGYNVGSGTAIQDVIADAGIVYIHYDTTIGHNNLIKSDPNKYFGSFQGDPAEYWYGPGFLQFIKSIEDSGQYKRANNKMAVITSAGVYSVNIANAIKERGVDDGWENSLFETVNVPISEWGPTLAKIRQDPPAVIAITHFYPQDLAQFMTQFVPDPTPSLIYMQYGPSLPAFRDIGKEKVNGVLYSTVVGVPQDEIGNAFEKKYKDKFGANAGHLSGCQPYDGAHGGRSRQRSPAAPANRQRRAEPQGRRSHPHDDLSRRQRRHPLHPDEQAAYAYPDQTKDPSLGMPHFILQIQDYTKPTALIAPVPYDTAAFAMPPWIKA
jgi:branched-chain amino acid transport system substrate-binding protein